MQQAIPHQGGSPPCDNSQRTGAHIPPPCHVYLQELLLDKGVALVLNVKRDLLDRIARCTDAEVGACFACLLAGGIRGL